MSPAQKYVAKGGSAASIKSRGDEAGASGTKEQRSGSAASRSSVSKTTPHSTGKHDDSKPLEKRAKETKTASSQSKSRGTVSSSASSTSRSTARGTTESSSKKSKGRQGSSKDKGKPKSKTDSVKSPSRPVEKKEPKSRPKTKVIVRKLPANVTEEDFQAKLVESGWPESAMIYFVQGKVTKRRTTVPGRAYVYFHNNSDEAQRFIVKFASVTFPDNANKGSLESPEVELAMNQKVPKKSRRKDPRMGTIEKDPDYLSFLASLEEVQEKAPSAEAQLDAKENEAPAEVPVAPLVEFLKKKAELKVLAKSRPRERERDHRSSSRKEHGGASSSASSAATKILKKQTTSSSSRDKEQGQAHAGPKSVKGKKGAEKDKKDLVEDRKSKKELKSAEESKRSSRDGGDISVGENGKPNVAPFKILRIERKPKSKAQNEQEEDNANISARSRQDSTPAAACQSSAASRGSERRAERGFKAQAEKEQRRDKVENATNGDRASSRGDAARQDSRDGPTSGPTPEDKSQASRSSRVKRDEKGRPERQIYRPRGQREKEPLSQNSASGETKNLDQVSDRVQGGSRSNSRGGANLRAAPAGDANSHTAEKEAGDRGRQATGRSSKDSRQSARPEERREKAKSSKKQLVYTVKSKGSEASNAE